MMFLIKLFMPIGYAWGVCVESSGRLNRVSVASELRPRRWPPSAMLHAPKLWAKVHVAEYQTRCTK